MFDRTFIPSPSKSFFLPCFDASCGFSPRYLKLIHQIPPRPPHFPYTQPSKTIPLAGISRARVFTRACRGEAAREEKRQREVRLDVDVVH